MIRRRLVGLSTVAILAIAGCSEVLTMRSPEQPAVASIATVTAERRLRRFKRNPTARGIG